MTVKDTLALVSPTEGQAPPTFSTGWLNPPAGSGSQFEARAAAAFTPDAFGILLPVMSTSFRRGEYTLVDGAQTTGQVVWAFPLEILAFGTSTNSIIASMVNGTTGQLEIRFGSSGTSRALTLRNLVATANTVTGSATYSLNTKYRLELSLTFGGNLELRTYLWGSDTLIEAITCSAASITQVTKAYMGLNAASAGWSARYGMAKYADTWVGSAAWAPAAGAAALSGSGSLSGAASPAVPAPATLSGSGSLTARAPRFTYNLGPGPWYPSHRGAIGPEETQGTYDRSLLIAPTSGLECDVQEASDGYVLSHDDTTTRTAATGSPFASSDISTLTVAQYKTVQIKDLSGRGFAAESAMGLDDWFARYGPSRDWLIPELKNGSSANTFGDYVIATGYAYKTVVQAFSRPNAEALAAKGLEVVHLIQSGGATDWSAIAAAGIKHVARNAPLWTTGDIAAAKAAGLTAGIFTIDNDADRDTWIANGINGFIFTNYPDVLNPGVSLSLSGSGSLSATASPSVARTAALSGTGSLSGSGLLGATVGASLAGNGALTATAIPAPKGSATLSGTGTLTAVGSGSGPGAATLSSTGTLAATGTPAPRGSAALSGTGTLTPAGLPSLSRAATLSGLGTLSAIGITSGAGACYVTVGGARKLAIVYVVIGGTRKAAARSVILAGAKHPV